ncbi:hypothetical protein [Armatimonas rosea]|uniref:Flp pilus assembly secretin CpaC n=1 Tax=Armatimonas rosea TaxID=685828 RepID=A0A7W9W3C9_ARMRO|nr:hypothetical protein [Armatimonas rosea]MBB6048274.1 Flp pilus assembly secretin CpaC [Armatimonas rosea]
MLLIPVFVALGTLAQGPTSPSTLLPGFTVTTKVLEVPEATKVTLENITRLPNAKTVVQPSVSMLAGNEGKTAILSQLEYPITETAKGQAQWGWSIAATPTEEKDGTIRLAFQLEHSFLAGYNGTLPTITRRSVQTTYRLKSGESFLLPLGKGENKAPLYALVSVTRDRR